MKEKFSKAVSTGLVTKIIVIVAICALLASAGLIGAKVVIDKRAEEATTARVEESAVASITPDSDDSATYSGTYGNDIAWSFDKNTGALSITGTGDLAVNDLTPPWGVYKLQIKSIEIGNGVTAIGDWVFETYESVTSVTISDSVTSIGNGAFTYCENITSVTIGDGGKTIGEDAFRHCHSLANLTLGNSVEVIGNYAFNNCNGLTSLTIPDSVTTIGDGAFSGCNRMLEGVAVVPDSVINMGEDVFRCTSLAADSE